jgi:hypothetical protein
VDAVANATLIRKSLLSAYLMHLQDLKRVERRLLAIPSPVERLRSRKGRAE